MSLVVADSSPLNYLALCHVLEVLPRLYGQVVVPQAVFDELSHANAPDPVRSWLEALPTWASVRAPTEIDEGLALGRGEVEAICLAAEIGADEVLLDERRARRAARQRGLTVTGTLGVLEAAAKRHLIDLRSVVQKLVRTNFRIEPELVEQALKRDAVRREAEKSRRRKDDREAGLER
jgi:predicted nucleic acid-binding protein